MGRRVVDTPLGPLTVLGAAGALVEVSFGRLGDGDCGAGDADGDPVVETATRQLAEWFAGRRRQFELPLRPTGTAFEHRVWAAMSEIPFGATATYGEIARRLGTSARAVGNACGRNRLPIIVPCHRVVGRNGLGGYSGMGGRTTKLWLLNYESPYSMD
ncbi:MAG: methylated-DNA--[protein]-cysteine S-methyltransferase [Azospirillum sp.]|nr:methylated-DNA--[protein]-cysteine S-methyltransferase [Azospirillum sp.]